MEAPFVINPVAIYQVTGAWYVNTGDVVIRYDWEDKKWLVPNRAPR